MGTVESYRLRQTILPGKEIQGQLDYPVWATDHMGM